MRPAQNQRTPTGSMGAVYLPAFYRKNQPIVGRYKIHGWYGPWFENWWFRKAPICFPELADFMDIMA